MELLNLLLTTRKTLYLNRLFKELSITLNKKKVRIEYNNI